MWKNKPNFLAAKMNVYIYMKRDYEDFSDFGRRKNKAKSKPNKPNLFSPQIYLEVENPVWKNKANFQQGYIGLNSYLKGEYGK